MSLQNTFKRQRLIETKLYSLNSCKIDKFSSQTNLLMLTMPFLKLQIKLKTLYIGFCNNDHAKATQLLKFYCQAEIFRKKCNLWSENN